MLARFAELQMQVVAIMHGQHSSSRPKSLRMRIIDERFETTAEVQQEQEQQHKQRRKQ